MATSSTVSTLNGLRSLSAIAFAYLSDERINDLDYLHLAGRRRLFHYTDFGAMFQTVRPQAMNDELVGRKIIVVCPSHRGARQ